MVFILKPDPDLSSVYFSLSFSPFFLSLSKTLSVSTSLVFVLFITSFFSLAFLSLSLSFSWHTMTAPVCAQDQIWSCKQFVRIPRAIFQIISRALLIQRQIVCARQERTTGALSSHYTPPPQKKMQDLSLFYTFKLPALG